MKDNMLSAKWRILAVAAFVFLTGALCFAQTVRPVVSELANPAKGRVEYVNDGFTPLNVVLEAKSFTVSETGEIAYRPLDPGVHLKLSTTSFRIQPQQTYYVSYEASAPKSPTWFVIYAAFSGFTFRTSQGLSVRLQLPHTVYLLPKQSAALPDIRVNRAELELASNKALLEVENTGDNMGRVLETQLVYSKKKQEGPGFPLFPHSKRIVEVALERKVEDDNPPMEVVFEFQKFKIEKKLQRASASAALVPEGEKAVSP